MKKRILGLLMALVMVLSVYPINVSAASDVYKETGDYLENQAKQSAPTVNSIGGEWVVIGLARSGRSVPEGYYDNAVQYVETNINDKSQLHRNKSTENSRVILALTAAGYDVTNVAGHNLLEGLTSMTYLKKQGINGPIWALIAYDSHDYAIPTGDGTVTRDTLIDTILAAQITDGGWNLDADATTSDPDMTGMAIQALAPYYNSDGEVKAAVNKAITCLSDAQNSDGGYSSSGDANSESVVQVIVALTALGINPDSDSRFIKNGNSVLDSLYTYAVDGGGFEHIKGEGLNQMATEQGYYALTAYERFKAGKTSLYDMTDVKLPADIEAEEAKKEADKKAAAEVDKKIEAIGTVTLDSESKINEARNAYNGLTADQKSYVTKLATLEEAETKLAELKKAAAEEEEKRQQIAKDKAAAAEVDKKIEAIGTVTLDSESKINEARNAYNGLTADQKSYVTKLGTLEAAETKLAELKKTAAEEEEKQQQIAKDKAAAAEVDKKIEAIGTVTLDSESKINEARNAYNGLTADQKGYVTKLGTLEAAEEKIAQLKEEANKPDVPDEPDQPNNPDQPEVPDIPENEVEFTDVKENAWYYKAVQWAVENEIAAGYEEADGTYMFQPEATCTRAQGIAFVHRCEGNENPGIGTKNIFKDIKTTDWFYKDVLWGVEEDVAAGFEEADGTYTFQPNGECTRAQILAFICRAKGNLKPGKNAENPFKDVSEDAWYYDNVLWAVENGIVSGYKEADGTYIFQPEKICTRAEIVQMLYKAYNE